MELRGELEQLRDTLAAQVTDDRERQGFEWVAFDREVDALNGRAAEPWERARAELGRRYAVGFLGAGMRRPVWSPSELSGDDDDDYGLEVGC